jgi:DeoR/GlpR family transcriptional regulator of sugar metabolism
MARDLAEDGRERILRRLRTEGSASVRDLARDLGVSPVTVHRYLARLESDGLITRQRGGARLHTGAAIDLDFEHRLAAHADRKAAIARRAMELVPTTGSVFIDASTTCLFAAREIERRVNGNLTIVTTSPAILRTFSSASVRVIAAPGELDPTLRAILGPWAVEFLEDLNLQTALISGVGITLEAGLTTTHRQLADLLRQVVRRSDRVYILIDSSKFGRTALLNIVEPSSVAGVISDAALDPAEAEAYRARGVNLIVAEE